MQFKKILLDDYLQTDDGKKCYEFFQNIKDIFFHDQKRFFDFVDSWLTSPVAQDFFGIQNLQKSFTIMTLKMILANLRISGTLIKIQNLRENSNQKYLLILCWYTLFARNILSLICSP